MARLPGSLAVSASLPGPLSVDGILYLLVMCPGSSGPHGNCPVQFWVSALSSWGRGGARLGERHVLSRLVVSNSLRL